MYSLSKYYSIMRVATIVVLAVSLYNMFSCYGKQNLPERNLFLPFLLLSVAAASQIIVDVVLRNPFTKAITAKSITVVSCLSLLTADIIDDSRHIYSVFLCVITGAFLLFVTLYSSLWLLNVSEGIGTSSKPLYYLVIHFAACFFIIAKEIGLDNPFSTVFLLASIIAIAEVLYNYDVHNDYEGDSDKI